LEKELLSFVKNISNQLTARIKALRLLV